jgi:hypothetical protein
VESGEWKSTPLQLATEFTARLKLIFSDQVEIRNWGIINRPAQKQFTPTPMQKALIALCGRIWRVRSRANFWCWRFIWGNVVTALDI